MNEPAILTEVTEDKILVLTINRPKALNAINTEVMEGIGKVFSVKQPKHIIGVIIKGSGEKAFAAGADIKELAHLGYEDGKYHSKKGQDIFQSIEDYHIPVIALVKGFALGGGCELSMACHMRIGDASATFGQPEVKLGVLCGYGGTQRLVQLIGRAKAIEYLLTGDMINADTALSLGLLNHIVPTEELESKATSILKKIGRMGPLAVETTIKAANLGPSQAGYEYENDAFGVTLQSAESSEGLAAFIEKRRANFR